MRREPFGLNIRAQRKKVFGAPRELMTLHDPPKQLIGFVTLEDKKKTVSKNKR